MKCLPLAWKKTSIGVLLFCGSFTSIIIGRIGIEGFDDVLTKGSEAGERGWRRDRASGRPHKSL